MKLSIIIPVKNRAENTKKLLDKISNQLFRLGDKSKEIEIFVVENGSIENMDFLEEYRAIASFIIMHEPAISVGHARNAALDRASGDFIGFIDNDDDISDDYFETIYNKLDSNLDWLAWQWMSDDNIAIDFNENNPLKSCWALWRYCFNKRLFDGIRFDETKKAGSDLIIFSIITPNTKGIFIPKILYKFKWANNEDSLSHKNIRGEFNEI